jgi:hypothetical protein
MTHISKNGVALILFVASITGLNIEEAMAENVVLAITTLVSFALMVYNQLDRKDIKWGLLRKEPKK